MQNVRFLQLYNTPGALNYTSPVIHTVKLTGLKPNTTYYYRCGDATLTNELKVPYRAPS